MAKWKQGRDKISSKSPDALLGIGSIAEYLGFTSTTISRWIKFRGLPAMKTPTGRWFTTKDAITAWIIASGEAERKDRGWDRNEKPLSKVS